MNKEAINIFAPNWDPYDSYGRLANELANGLSDGYSVEKREGLEGAVPFGSNVGGFLLGYPSLFQMYGPMANMGPRVAITMFESSKIPDSWVEPLNSVDAVIVPAEFLTDVFHECGVTVPVYVVPLGISEPFMKYRARPVIGENPFTWLTIGDRGDRKGWNEVIQAFIRAFGDSHKHKLVIKSRSLPFHFTNENIHVIRDDLTDDQMIDLYQSSHVMAFATKGEGFGFPPREFAATGGLALATEWGGTADNLRQWGLPIPHSMVDAWPFDERMNGLGQWAQPNIDSLSGMMKHVYENYWSYTTFRVMASGFIQSHYRWDRFVTGCRSVYQKVVKSYGTDSHTNRTDTAQAFTN